MFESAPIEEHEDLCDLMSEFAEVPDQIVSSDEWSSDRGDEFIVDEELENWDRLFFDTFLSK